MHIKLNGTLYALDNPSNNLLALLQEKELTNGRFAVEVDGKLIPKSQLQTISLSDGMSIEVVQAVGGG